MRCEAAERTAMSISKKCGMKAIYVAGPFRGNTHWKVAQNVHRARLATFMIAKLGALPICPHSMFEQFDGTLTDQFWLDATMELFERCDAIAMTPGWERSSGSRSEWERAEERGVPVFYLDDEASVNEMRAWTRG